MASPITDKVDLAHDADLKATQKAENFLADAQAGNDSETKMGLIAALKLYPKASAWSIAISFAVVMEGILFIPTNLRFDLGLRHIQALTSS